MATETRTYNRKRIKRVLWKDGTTRWTVAVKCLAGCCEGNIVRGTLVAVKRHIERNQPRSE